MHLKAQDIITQKNVIFGHVEKFYTLFYVDILHLQQKLNKKSLKKLIKVDQNFKMRNGISNTFQSLDVNRDGVLSKEALIQGYKKIIQNQEQVEQQAERILEEIDKNLSGQIDYSEFIMASINQSKILSQKKIEQVFHIFDLDGDGYITKQELEDLMGTLNQYVWQLFLQETDHNKDGKISYQEFLKLFF